MLDVAPGRGDATLLGMIVGHPRRRLAGAEAVLGLERGGDVLNVGMMLPPVVVGLFVFLLALAPGSSGISGPVSTRRPR